MKPLIITLILIISIPTFAQPYFGIGLQNKGYNMNAGILVDKIDAQISFKTPLSSAEEAKIIITSIGRMFNISNMVTDNYSFTPSIGAAWVKRTDFTEYDLKSSMGPVSINKFMPAYGLEIGKDAYNGRISLVAKYIDKMYCGVNMRVFF
ncbi:MAG: hypothetical protein ACOYLO_02480 [Ferruginibacter sp.]